jgi:hypothetical protein
LVLLALTGIDFWIGKSKIGTKMETVKREGIDIVFDGCIKSMLKMLLSRLEKKQTDCFANN